MTAPVIELAPVDRCPSCFPGDNPTPCLPLSYADLDGCTIAAYFHSCGMAWATKFDEHWWPVDRSLAPVIPAESPDRSAA